MTSAGSQVETEREPETTKRRRILPRVFLAIAGLMFGLSLVRVIIGDSASDIDSAGTLSATIGLAVPIAMAGLGGLWAERAGVVNIGLEGMLILGTFGAGWAGYQWGAWAGVLAGVLLGAVGGLIHAIATVSFGVDHIVSGVAINILGLGATQYLAAVAFEGVPGGGSTQSPAVPDLPAVTVPGVADRLGAIADNQWFFISDLAALLRALTNNVSVLTIIAVLLMIGTYLVLWHTAFGLRLRSCGENPAAAETLGINVYKYKYIAVLVSGGMAGLGGAFLAIVASSSYRDGQTGGRGFIGLAAMIFGNWRPGGLAAGAGLFGYTDALRLRSGGTSVHALLLVLVFGMVILAAWQVYRNQPPIRPIITGGFAALILIWFLLTDVVPADFTGMTPYVATLLVLALASQRLRMPAADGVIYRRGEAG
ncbi:MAG: ABC transporter permease [Geodermatophilaceae bacterium]